MNTTFHHLEIILTVIIPPLSDYLLHPCSLDWILCESTDSHTQNIIVL